MPMDELDEANTSPYEEPALYLPPYREERSSPTTLLSQLAEDESQKMDKTPILPTPHRPSTRRPNPKCRDPHTTGPSHTNSTPMNLTQHPPTKSRYYPRVHIRTPRKIKN
uniref:Uncharacterized protein n=1 Tax=Knipowitschia caucasica TaxID=637954 RepID=A0AAV2MEY3_KNICA